MSGRRSNLREKGELKLVFQGVLEEREEDEEKMKGKTHFGQNFKEMREKINNFHLWSKIKV